MTTSESELKRVKIYFKPKEHSNDNHFIYTLN